MAGDSKVFYHEQAAELERFLHSLAVQLQKKLNNARMVAAAVTLKVMVIFAFH